MAVLEIEEIIVGVMVKPQVGKTCKAILAQREPFSFAKPQFCARYERLKCKVAVARGSFSSGRALFESSCVDYIR